MANLNLMDLNVISNIPNDWVLSKVKYIYKYQCGGTPDTTIYEYYCGDIPWITIGDLNIKYIDSTANTLSVSGVKSANIDISPKGSLLFSFKLSVGKVSFCMSDMYTNEAIITINPNNCTQDLNYLYYALPVFVVQNANENIYGAKLLNKELILNASILLPSRYEQKLIADFLDKECGRVDSILENLKEQIETLEKYKESLIYETVTKGLDASCKMKNTNICNIGFIPETWNIVPLKKIAELRTGSTPQDNEGVVLDNAFVNWFTPGDFHNELYLEESAKGLSHEIIEKKSINLFPAESILLVCIGTIGKVGYSKGKCYSNQQITSIFPFAINSKYLLYYMFSQSKYLKDTASYTIMPILNNACLGTLKVVVPSEKEQLDIVTFLEKKTLTINEIIGIKTNQIDVLEQYKKSLIYEYVTGKKRIERSEGQCQ